MSYPFDVFLGGAARYPVGMLTLRNGRQVYSTGRVLIGLRWSPPSHVPAQSASEKLGQDVALSLKEPR